MHIGMVTVFGIVKRNGEVRAMPIASHDRKAVMRRIDAHTATARCTTPPRFYARPDLQTLPAFGPGVRGIAFYFFCSNNQSRTPWIAYAVGQVQLCPAPPEGLTPSGMIVPFSKTV